VTTALQRSSPKSRQVRRLGYGLSVQATRAPQTNTIKVSHSIWNVNRKSLRGRTRFTRPWWAKKSRVERQSPKATSSPQISPRFHPCKQKRKSCPSCQSCLKLFSPLLSLRVGKPRHTLAQKATFDTALPTQTLVHPIKTPTRHTRHSRRQALAPPPRETACKTRHRPLSCRARAPGEFPSRGGFTLNPPPAPGLPGSTPSPCPSLLLPPPEAEVRAIRPGSVECQRRVRRASAPDIPVAPAFPGASAGFEEEPRRVHHLAASSAQQGGGGKLGHQKRMRRLSAPGGQGGGGGKKREHQRRGGGQPAPGGQMGGHVQAREVSAGATLLA